LSLFLPTDQGKIMEEKIQSTFWHLSNFNVLKSLEKPDLMKLSKLVHDKECPKDQVLYLPNDKSDKLYFLKTGKVKITTMSEDGKEMIHDIMMPGQIFGELSLVSSDGEVRETMAEAIETGIICSIEASVFNEFLAGYPQVNFRMTKLIGLRLKKIQRRISDMWFKTAPQRIREFIKDMANQHGRDVGHEKVIRMKLTHQDIASMTATARQTVTTTLSNLESEGIITYDRSRILIRDMSKL